MKSIQFKIVLLLGSIAILFSSCTKDTDVTVTPPAKTLFSEDFNNTNLTTTGWVLNSEVGTKFWSQASYKSDGYAQFSSYGSGQPVNVSWLISPPINMDTQDGERIYFQSCQDGYVRNIDNSLEFYVSTDYNGSNFMSASWQKINFNVPTQDTTRFAYLDSGIIDLSSYKGNLYLAFKVKGTSSLTGGYQLDKIRVFY